MNLYQWNKFKKNYEIFAYILVYVGYFLHLIILLRNYVNIIYVLIGYIFFLFFMYRAFFYHIIILLHTTIFLVYIDSFYTSLEGKIFSIIFLIPFYSIILYSFLSVFGLDSKIEAKIKTNK